MNKYKDINIEEMDNQQLLELYSEYDELLHGKNTCYGIADLFFFQDICHEMDRREEPC